MAIAITAIITTTATITTAITTIGAITTMVGIGTTAMVTIITATTTMAIVTMVTTTMAVTDTGCMSIGLASWRFGPVRCHATGIGNGRAWAGPSCEAGPARTTT